jgi:competence protein ComEC
MVIGKSRFTLAALGGFILGIFLADKIPLGFSWEIGIIIGLAIAAIFFWQDKLILLVTISLAAFFVGLSYYHFWDFRENQKQLTYNSELRIQNAEIISKPQIANDQRFEISYEKTKVLVIVSKFPQYQYGDILKISGKLEKPYPQDYYFKHGIKGEIKNPENIVKVGGGGNVIVKEIYNIGNAFENSLTKILPEPYAAFQDGLILGTKINIPDSLMSEFNRTGTTHIVAVSGYNVTIIIMFISYLLMRFGRKISFFGSMLVIVVFVILTGAVASVLRAGILMALVIFAKFIGRRPYYPILILLVADLMLLFNPYALKNDISFQLSFLAFTGLIFVSPKIEQIKFIKDLPDTVKKAFSETMGAQIAVLPILLFNFGILSFVAPLANILILPIVPLSMFLGFVGGIGGLVWLELGRILGLVAWIPLKYMIVVEDLLSKVPGAAVTLKLSNWWWIPVYYLLVLIFFGGKFGLNEQSGDQNYREQEEF